MTYDDYRRAILDLTVGDRFCFRDVQIIREDGPSLNGGTNNPPIGDTRYRYRIDAPPAGTFSFVSKKGGAAAKDIQVVSGGYRLWLALAPGVAKSDADPVLQAFLHNNRNLCESFSQIRYLKDTPVSLELVIDLDDDVVDFAPLLAQVYAVCSAALLAPVQRRSAAMRLKGEAAECVYHGPRLQHGWIEALPPVTTDWKSIGQPLEVLVIAADALPGVNRVSRLLDQQSIEIAAGTRPLLWTTTLNDGFKSVAEALCKHVVLRKRGRTVDTGSMADSVQQALQYLPDPFRVPEIGEIPRSIAYGEHREPGTYAGASTLLPAVYGLQVDPSQLTLAARQLVAFLQPLEQCLADELDQLRKLPWLLSFDRRDPQSRVRGASWPVFDTASPAQAQIEGVLGGAISNLRDIVLEVAKDSEKELAILDYLLHYFGEARAMRSLLLAKDKLPKPADTTGGKTTGAWMWEPKVTSSRFNKPISVRFRSSPTRELPSRSTPFLLCSVVWRRAWGLVQRYSIMVLRLVSFHFTSLSIVSYCPSHPLMRC
ncbi:hypothetical protein [Burkholderia ambifaria]|uniref:hypothetical protein n=1 Tax=Burkholderia ambifaria TaxID=152480 RepID=UPI0012FDB3A4|nr:hypothetical protein [Burkholderia ambifaria]